MDFRQRLLRAAERGQQARDAQAREQAAKALSEEEWKRLHSTHRFQLTEHIEACLQQLAENFPGFHYESVIGDQGWGGAVRRDDLEIVAGRRENYFSRLQIAVSPPNAYHVLEITAKGAVRNRENFSRKHFQHLKDFDLDTFRGLIEQWTLDYAEHYAAATA
jgi:hypothetical protein